MGHIRVDLPNTNNKWVEFGLTNVDISIIRVRFGLSNIDTIRILIRHEHDPSTQITIPNVIHWIRDLSSNQSKVERACKFVMMRANTTIRIGIYS